MKNFLGILITCSAILFHVPAEAGLLKKARNLAIVGGVVVVGAAWVKAAQAKKCRKAKETGFGDAPSHCGMKDDGIIEKSNTGARVLRKNLNIERKMAGMPPDPEDCEAHHIVPENDGREKLKIPADAAREAISDCVDINSAENGIFLPGKRNATGCDGPAYHRTIHTEINYRTIAERLVMARRYGGCDGLRDELRIIKNIMRSGGGL